MLVLRKYVCEDLETYMSLLDHQKSYDPVLKELLINQDKEALRQYLLSLATNERDAVAISKSLIICKGKEPETLTQVISDFMCLYKHADSSCVSKPKKYKRLKLFLRAGTTSMR
jgi:hypothetical protein